MQQAGTADLPTSITTAAADVDWWQRFQDPLLGSLVARAAARNLTLQVAAAVLAQSRAMQGIAAADQFPQINGNASYTRLQASKEGVLNLTRTMTGGSGSATSANGQGAGATANGTGIGALGMSSAGIAPFSLFQFGLDAAWEADFWGRVRREQEYAQAGEEAGREQQHAALLGVIAEVARNYFELRRLQANRAAQQEQLEIAGQQLEIIRLKNRHGVVTGIELENTRVEVDSVQALLPQLDQQIEQAGNQLSLLTASQPGDLAAELQSSHTWPVMPASVGLGLPSELAQRRPDIREAEANLHRALANIGMATADFYPRLTLSGSTGLQALALNNLGSWSALQYAMGPSLTLPVFQGGRLEATLELRQAEQQQAAAQYQNTVLAAWYEIDNNLAAFAEAQRRQQILNAAVDSNQKLLSLAEYRYARGVTDQQPVLQARAALSRARQAATDAAANTAGNLIALYKALGGGWQP